MITTLQVSAPAFLYPILSLIVLSLAESSAIGTMKAELKAATEALKKALHSAIDDPKFNRNNLSELWRHYNGVQTIYESCADDVPQIQLQQDLLTETPAGYDFWAPDENGAWPSSPIDGISLSSDTIAAAGPVNLDTSFGQDVITFS